MSRIGKAPIVVPSGVTVTVDGTNVKVKGPKGELTQEIDPAITVVQEDGVLTFTRPSDEKEHRSKHGLYRALVANMVQGVTEGYKVEMELVGVGYRASAAGQ
jgi:large subunit ribosomal protein L6